MSNFTCQLKYKSMQSTIKSNGYQGKHLTNIKCLNAIKMYGMKCDPEHWIQKSGETISKAEEHKFEILTF